MILYFTFHYRSGVVGDRLCRKEPPGGLHQCRKVHRLHPQICIKMILPIKYLSKSFSSHPDEYTECYFDSLTDNLQLTQKQSHFNRLALPSNKSWKSISRKLHDLPCLRASLCSSVRMSGSPPLRKNNVFPIRSTSPRT